MAAVGADHDARALADALAAPRVTADTGHTAILDQQFVDGEALAQIRSGSHRRFDQNGIQYIPTRCDLEYATPHGRRRTNQGERPEIRLQLPDRRAVRGNDLVEEAPIAELGDGG